MLPVPNLCANPQDNWYLERDRELGFIGGTNTPQDIIHAPDGKTFIVEISKDRVQFLDQNQQVFALVGAGDEP